MHAFSVFLLYWWVRACPLRESLPRHTVPTTPSNGETMPRVSRRRTAAADHAGAAAAASGPPIVLDEAGDVAVLGFCALSVGIVNGAV